MAGQCINLKFIDISRLKWKERGDRSEDPPNLSQVVPYTVFLQNWPPKRHDKGQKQSNYEHRTDVHKQYGDHLPSLSSGSL